MTRSLRAVAFVGIALLAFSAFGASDPIKSINGPLVSPAPTGAFVFVVAGDSRPTALGAPLPRVLKTIFAEIRLIHPDFVLWTGDTVYGYGDDKSEELAAEYSKFFGLAKDAAVPIFNAPGNHEIHGELPCDTAEAEKQFKDHFGVLYGSFDYQGGHFIALDTEQCGHTITDPKTQAKVQVIDGDQLAWLKQDLEANKGARAIFIFFHTEVTSAGKKDDAGDTHPPLGNSPELMALFKKYSVKAVFQGHEHLFYQDPDPDVRYFVAGGAGAPLYASPENGGFSHYLVVEVGGNQPTYKVVEPGHLYVEEAEVSKSDKKIWLINSTDTPLPARRIETSVPASLGKCAALVAVSGLETWNHKPIPVPLEIATCRTSGKKRELTLRVLGDVPAGSSVPISIHARPKP